jgi:hypothetical protein
LSGKELCLEMSNNRLLLHEEGSKENLLDKIPIRRASVDLDASNPSGLAVVLEGYPDSAKIFGLMPEQITLIQRMNVLDVPEWEPLAVPVSLKDLFNDILVDKGYEVMFTDGRRYLIGSGQVSDYILDQLVTKYRMLVCWEEHWEISVKQLLPTDLCAFCNHKRERHRPRLICGALVNESGIPEYCQCMTFREPV